MQTFPSFIFGSRASLVFDVIVISMPLILIALGFSLYQVRYRRNFDFHKRVQLVVAVLLLVVVVWFEIDVRIFGWSERAKPSPYYNSILFPFLYFHVAIAACAAGIWTAQIWLALRHFGKDYAISAKNKKAHMMRGWLAVWLMVLTTITGWIFYFLAFMAT